MASKNTKMQQWLNYRIRVTVADSRMLVGSFMAFDKYMNLVICDCEEFQKVKLKTKHPKTGKVVMEEKEVKRLLGFVIIRGESIVSMTAEAPPPAEPKKQGEGPQAGPGKGQAAGRGVPVAPLSGGGGGLSAPVRGVGGPAPLQMQPKQGALPGMPGMPPGMRPPAGMR